MDLFSFCPGAHTAPENHIAAVSFYGDSPRVNQGVALKCFFNTVLYIERRDRRRYSERLLTEITPMRGSTSVLPAASFRIASLTLATQSSPPVLHLYFDAAMRRRKFHSMAFDAARAMSSSDR